MTPSRPSSVGEVLASLVSVTIRQRSKDLSLTGASTLAALERSGPSRVGALARAEGVAQPSMTALVGQLEASGWVRRFADERDGRAVLVELTAEGRAHLAARRQHNARALDDAIDELTADERTALATALPALVQLVDKMAQRPVAGER